MRSTTAGSGDWRPTLGGAASSPSAFSRSSVPLWVFPMGAPVLSRNLPNFQSQPERDRATTSLRGSIADEKRHEPARTGTNHKMLRFHDRFPSGPHLKGDSIKESSSHSAGPSKSPECRVCRPDFSSKLGQSDVLTLHVLFQSPGSNMARNAGRQP